MNTNFLILSGGVVVLVAIIAAFKMALNSSRREGAATVREESERLARESQEKMNSELLKKGDPNDSRDRLGKGTF